jgi:hypothetical protein
MATTVLQVENVGVLAPYSYERSTLAAAGVDFEVVRCADGAELVAAEHHLAELERRCWREVQQRCRNMHHPP